jgi:hypothetical protein
MAGWGPIGEEQEGESGALRAPKGEKFPTCPAFGGNRVTAGASERRGNGVHPLKYGPENSY